MHEYVRDFWPGYAVIVLGLIVMALHGTTSGPMLVGWGGGFTFATLVMRVRRR